MSKEKETVETVETAGTEKGTKERTAGREWIGYGIVALLLAVLTAFACGFFAADQSIESALDPAALSEQFADGEYVPQGLDLQALANKEMQEEKELLALFLEESKTQVDAKVEKDAEAGLRERMNGFPEDFIESALLSDAFINEKNSSKEYGYKQAEKKINEKFDKAKEGAEQKRQSDRTAVSVLYILLLLVPAALLIPVIKWSVTRNSKRKTISFLVMPLLSILCGTAVGNLLGFFAADELVLSHYGSRYILTLSQAGSVFTILGITVLLPICLLLLISYFAVSLFKERA